MSPPADAARSPAQFNVGSDSAPAVVEAHLDLLCPDCAEAYPVLLALAERLGPASLQLGVRLFPLPYHRNGFLVAQSAQTVRRANASAAFPFISAVFFSQAAFWDAKRFVNIRARYPRLQLLLHPAFPAPPPRP